MTTAGLSAACLLIVIVNYRTARLTIDCLNSLLPEAVANPGLRVEVIDNASGDGSAGRIASAIAAMGWGDWAGVRESPVNGGFAHGNNMGIRPHLDPASPRTLFWMVNPDTVIRPGAVAAILSFMADHPKAGAVGTAIDDETGAPWPYAFRFPSLLSEFEHGMRLSVVSRVLSRWRVMNRMGDRPARVEWVSGASMVVRRAVFETAGLLDEGYFLYYEETDFFRRVARYGWQCWYVPDARIMHISGQSTGLTGSGAAARRVPAYWFDSRRRYFVKNHGRAYAVAIDVIWILAHATWRMRCWLRGRPHGGSPHFLRDFLARSAIVRGDARANTHLEDGPPAGTARPRRLSEA